MIMNIKLALNYLACRKARTALTTLAIVFGVMVIFGLNGIIPALQESFIKGIRSSGDGVDMTITSSSRNTFNSGAAEKSASVRGVSNVTGILEKPVILPNEFAFKTKDGKVINSISFIGINPDEYNKLHDMEITAGSMLEKNSTGKLLISDSLASKTGLGAGETVKIPSVSGVISFTIEGIYKNKGFAGKEALIMQLDEAQKLFNQAGRINTIEVKLAGDANAEEVKSNIMKELGEGFSSEASGAASELMSAVKMGQTIFSVFGYISILMGGFIILVSFRAVAVERRRDIGLLRAIGCTKKRVLGIILAEGVIQGIAGTVLGIITGYALAWIFIISMNGIWEQLMKVSFGTPSFSLETWIIAIVLGIGVTIAGGIVPALNASRVTPLEALRTVSTAARGRKSNRRGIIGFVIMAISLLGIVSGNLQAEASGWLFFMIGLMIAGPFIVKPLTAVVSKLVGFAFMKEGEMSKGNIRNQPERAASTAYTVTIALALVISLAGFSVSAVDSSKQAVEKSLGSDFILMPQSLLLGSGNIGAGSELSDSIGKTKGIGGVTGISLAASKSGSNDLQVIGVDPEKYPVISGLVFSEGDAGKAYKQLGSGRYLIANGILASAMGIKTGDKIKLETPEGRKEYTIAAIGFDFLSAKISTVYISKANMEADFHEKNDVLVMADAVKGSDMEAVEKSLQEKVKDYPAFELFNAADMKKTMMESVNASMSAVYIVLIVMIIPSLIALINTLGIGVLERTREIGVMRAVGALRRQVKRIITAESLILALIGTLLGLASGIWLGHILVLACNSSGFKFTYFFPLEGVAAAIVLGVLLGIAGARLPARRAAKLDVVKALSYE